jgi:hypothetical protein
MPSHHPDTPASSQASAPRYCDGREGEPVPFGSPKRIDFACWNERFRANRGTDDTCECGRTVAEARFCPWMSCPEKSRA